ncbi:hypothetical protein G6F40_016804 [Rhizopus arrhizus]|nr:hypothetical protein G6F40_016804 [Rhizopus arrhizus]
MVEVLKVTVDRRAALHGPIAVVALAGAASNLVGIAADERKQRFWLSVQRHGQHVVAVVEDLLRAVAMVHVDIQHGHAAKTLGQTLRGDRPARRRCVRLR